MWKVLNGIFSVLPQVKRVKMQRKGKNRFISWSDFCLSRWFFSSRKFFSSKIFKCGDSSLNRSTVNTQKLKRAAKQFGERKPPIRLRLTCRRPLVIFFAVEKKALLELWKQPDLHKGHFTVFSKNRHIGRNLKESATLLLNLEHLHWKIFTEKI